VSGGTVAAVENERSPRFRGDADVHAWAGEHGVAYLAWSPLGGPDAGRLGELHPAFADVAEDVGLRLGERVTAQEVALAWLLAAGPTTVPIPAFTRTPTADSSARADALELTSDELSRLDDSPANGRSVYPD
jgi:diketogulonate reductase-like aldo/keto reductase